MPTEALTATSPRARKDAAAEQEQRNPVCPANDVTRSRQPFGRIWMKLATLLSRPILLPSGSPVVLWPSLLQL